jgi:hypothetical protein
MPTMAYPVKLRLSPRGLMVLAIIAAALAVACFALRK